jgi:hypothetical protein
MDATSPTVRLEVPPALRERVSSLALNSGLRPTATADLALVVVPGARLPDSLDRLMHDSAPHLVVRILGSEVVLGPFVVPGVTACCRCVVVADAAEDVDPTRALRNAFAGDPTSYAPLPRTVWPLLTIAVGMAAQDVVAWHRGERPGTWSATWTIRADVAPEWRRWRTHPWCGCGWFDVPVGA